MKRRLLLQGLVALVCGRRVAAAPDATSPPSQKLEMSAAELRTVLAYGEVLVEGRQLSPDERRYLSEHVEDSGRRDAESLTRYRTTARLLDRLAGTRFADLAFGPRLALVARHRLDSRPANADETVGPFREEILLVRTYVVPDLIEGYWSSPVGWATLGYATFPGRCGDLERYTRRE